MNYFQFKNIKLSGIATAVPDNHQKISEYAYLFQDSEVERFCAATGIYEKYNAYGVGTTTSDLCVAAANKLFDELQIDRNTIDGLIFITQTPDYFVPPTSCVIQHRLGLNNCGLVYDSNIGCTAFPFGLQMACANIMAGCKKILLLIGDSNPNIVENKNTILFGNAGVAVIVEKSNDSIFPLNFCIDTIGSGYKALIAPYGMERHPLSVIAQTRGFEFATYYNNAVYMSGPDVFTFSIKEVPRVMKAFLKKFNEGMDDFDLISMHQANKMIIDNIVKRIKAPKEKVINSISRFGNTRGASPIVNICDYVENNDLRKVSKKILIISFGAGLNVTIASFEIDLSVCLPIVKTKKIYNDNITSETYFK